MRIHTSQIGPLACHTVDSQPSSPQALVILCHGYGASGDDLVPLAQNLAPTGTAAPCVRFIFPQGPLSLQHLHIPHGRAWWHLDSDLMQQRADDPSGFARSLQHRIWPGLAQARKMLRQVVDEALQQASLGFDRLVLGGFSQGAMLATDLTLRLDEAPAGLLVLSGSLADKNNWRRLMAQRAGLRVVLSHGRGDPILPFENADALHALFVQKNCCVKFIPFDGGHAIVMPGLKACASLISEVLERV